MMKNWLLILCVMGWQLAPQDAVAANRFPVETAVEVVDVDGDSLPGITVNLSYLTLVESKLPERQRAETDAEGRVRFEGRGYRRISIYIHEDGYYGHRENHEIIEFLDGEPHALGEIRARIALKEVRDPIVMLADGFFRDTIPGYDQWYGYDFFANDWVEPHGSGHQADALFSATVADAGSSDWRWYDKSYAIRFPNEGDGLIPFKMSLQDGSILKSAHEAPSGGYQARWEWEQSRKPHEGRYLGRQVEDYDENRGYYLRLRTVHDEKGDVKEAYYGKIYGDFRFYGYPPEKPGFVSTAYYINPTANDRNVEAVSGETLLESSDRLDKPRLP